MHSSLWGSDVLKSFTCSFPPYARHAPKWSSAQCSCSHPLFPITFPLYPFRSLFLSCSLAFDHLTIFALAPLRLVLAEAADAESLHWLLCLRCSQMLLPPHSLHLLLCRLCSQRLLPPQYLHMLLSRCWTQRPLRLQSLSGCVPLWYSLLACNSSLRAIREV